MENEINMFKTNNFLTNKKITNQELLSQRELSSTFVEYHVFEKTSMGCRFTTKKRSTTIIRFECSFCRSVIDKSKRKEMEIKEKPSCFVATSDAISWVREEHITECTLQEYGVALSRTSKNQAVITKSLYNVTSKQAYDGEMRVLLSEHKDEVTSKNIGEGFGNFKKSRAALDKAHKRKHAASTSNFFNEEKEIVKENTIVIPSRSLAEEPDFFYVYQSKTSGVIVLGTKFLIRKFFESRTVVSDGTFKIAPNGYTQTYILWFVNEGIVEGEQISRNKAVAAVYILLKSKRGPDYDEAFDALEEYRIKNHIQYPQWESYIVDDEKAVQNSINRIYPGTPFTLCIFHINSNVVKEFLHNNLSHYIKKCNTDEQKWTYNKLRQILCIPFLPSNKMEEHFVRIESSIKEFHRTRLDPMQMEVIETVMNNVRRKYYGNKNKCPLICKFKIQHRTSNMAERAHNGLNKSSLVARKGNLNSMIQGLMELDVLFRSESILFDDKGPVSLPNHNKYILSREQKLLELYQKMDNDDISDEDFLTEVADLFINKKWFEAIKEACQRIESNPDIIEEEVNDYIGCILHQEPVGRQRTLSQRFFGHEWMN